MRLEEQRRINRPLEEVFDYTSDFANIEQWDPGVVRSRRLGEGRVGVGTKFEVEAKFGRGTTAMVYEITAYEPHKRVVLEGRGEKLNAIDDIRFRRDGDTTVVDYTADLDFHGLVGLVEPLMRPILKGVGKRALDGLAATLR